MDTVIQMDSRIVFSAPVDDRANAEQALAKLGTGFSEQHGWEGERRRRRDEEPSWSRLLHPALRGAGG